MPYFARSSLSSETTSSKTPTINAITMKLAVPVGPTHTQQQDSFVAELPIPNGDSQLSCPFDTILAYWNSIGIPHNDGLSSKCCQHKKLALEDHQYRMGWHFMVVIRDITIFASISRHHIPNAISESFIEWLIFNLFSS